MTTNRMVPRLINDGFIERVIGGKRPRFRVRTASPTLRVLAYLDAALGLLEEREPWDPEAAERVVEQFRRSIVANQGLVDGAGPSPTRARRAKAKPRAKAVRKT